MPFGFGVQPGLRALREQRDGLFTCLLVWPHGGCPARALTAASGASLSFTALLPGLGALAPCALAGTRLFSRFAEREDPPQSHAHASVRVGLGPTLTQAHGDMPPGLRALPMWAGQTSPGRGRELLEAEPQVQ